MHKIYIFENKIFYNKPVDMILDLIKTAQDIDLAKNKSYGVFLDYPSLKEPYFIIEFRKTEEEDSELIKQWCYALREYVHSFDDFGIGLIDDLHNIICYDLFVDNGINLLNLIKDQDTIR